MKISSAIPGALRPRSILSLCRSIGIIVISQFGVAALTAADVQLTWDENPTDEAISGYRLHYGITSGHYEYTDDVGTSNSATLADLGDNIRYYVALTAYSRDGLESELSEEFAFTTPAAPDETASDTDTGTGEETDSSDNSGENDGAQSPNEGESDSDSGLSSASAAADLAWNPNPESDGLVGYRIHYGTTSGTYAQTLDTGSRTSATVTGLAASTVYFVALTAYNEDGVESEFSDEFEFTTPEAPAETGGDAPGGNFPSPTGDTETPGDTEQDGEEEPPTEDPEEDESESESEGESDAEVEGELPSGKATADLVWNENPEDDGTVGYRLYYGIASGSYPAMIDTGASTSVTVTGLAEDTVYYVVLTAYNEDGLESLPSEEFEFLSSSNLPPEVILTQVGGDNATATGGTLILLATARDEDGSVSRVDFYDGTRLLHSDENFPYALRVSGLAPGIHQLRAIAVDDIGKTAESEALRIEIGAAISAPEPVTPTLTLTKSSDGKVPQFNVKATPGSLVQLEVSSDLDEWDVVSESRADESGDVEITDPTPEDELPNQRFYRVVTL